MLGQNKIKIIGIIIALLSTGAVLFCGTIFLKNTLTQKTQENGVKMEVTSEADTSGWLVYENKEYGYRFKYPQNLNVLDGENPQLGFVEPFKGGAFIVLPAKYPNIKSLNPKDPKTFLDFTIGITPIGKPEQYGKTIDEVVRHFVGSSTQVKMIPTASDGVIAVYDNGSRAYFIGKNIIYSFYIEGFNPEFKYVQDWLNNINNSRLTEWVNKYPQYTSILEGIYLTFEIL